MHAKRNRSVQGSCWTCKDRRVACDLTKPRCRRCDESCRDCSYGPFRVRWRDRAILTSRSGPESLRRKNTVVNLIQLTPDPSESHLVYFLRELSPRLTVGHKQACPDVSTLYANEAFRSVIIASSCTHQSMITVSAGVRPSRVESIETQQAAISVLREMTAQDISTSALRQIFQASTLLGVIQGMIDPCTDGVSFRSHLLATKSILDRLEGPQMSMIKESSLWTFYFSIFATMDLVNAILTGEQPLFDPNMWMEFGSCTGWWGTVPAADHFLACMSLFSHLASIASDIHKHDAPIEVGALLAVHSAVLRPEIEISDPDWRAFCNVYRHAASLYLYRAVARLPPDHFLVRHTMRDAMSELDQLPQQMRSCVLLPLLIFGMNCSTADEMEKVRENLRECNRRLSFGAVGTVQDFFSNFWESRESSHANGMVGCHDWWLPLSSIADSVCLF